MGPPTENWINGLYFHHTVAMKPPHLIKPFGMPCAKKERRGGGAYAGLSMTSERRMHMGGVVRGSDACAQVVNRHVVQKDMRSIRIVRLGGLAFCNPSGW